MIENLLGTDKLTTVEPLRHCSVSPNMPPSRIRSRLDQMSLNSWKTNFIIIYLTIIPQVRIEYETVDNQLDVGYNHLISNKRTHKVSRILPDFIRKNN